MAIQTTTRPDHRGRVPHPHRHWRVAGVALVVALGLALGLGIRAQLRDTAPAASVAQVSGPQANGRAVATTSTPAPVLYLVDTPEQAGWLRRFAAEVSQANGQPQLVGAVALPRTVDDAEVDGLPRAPGTRIMDLRTPATGTPDGSSRPERAAGWQPWVPQHLTVYIVGTPEMRDAVQYTIDDERRIGEFVVLGGPEDHADELAAQRLAEYRVAPASVRTIDLR